MNKLKQKIQKKSKNSQQKSIQSKKPLSPPSKELDESKLKTLKSHESVTASTVESNSSPTDATGEFRQLLNESKVKIHEAEQAKVKSARGRKPLPRDAQGNIIRESAQAPQTATSQVAPSHSIDLCELLVEPIQIISKIPARKHDIAQLAFDYDEAKALAVSIDKVFNAYIPDVEKMSPKTAALVTLGFTVSSLAIAKISIYSEVTAAREAEKVFSTPRPIPGVDDETSEAVSVDGKEFFKRRDPFQSA